TVSLLDFGVPPGPLPHAAWNLWVDVGLPVLGRAISPGWHEVGSFLGGSIRDFDERWPVPRLLGALREAGFDDVQARRLSLGGRGRAGGARPPPAPPPPPPAGWPTCAPLPPPPYTAWHLSYVAIGACLAPTLYTGRLAAAAVAFFLALGISAHALDELNGHPLATKIPDRVLMVLSVVPLLAAVAIGIAGAISFDLWLLVVVAIGLLLGSAYNLELFGGAIHNEAGFALAWGSFPLLTGYFVCAGTITWVALLAAAFAGLTSYAQRVLSTQVRHLRRRVAAVGGTIELLDGGPEAIRRETLAAAPERALQALAAAHVALAVALLVLRLT